MLKRLEGALGMRFNSRSILFNGRSFPFNCRSVLLLLVLCTFMICFSFWSRCTLSKEPIVLKYRDIISSAQPDAEFDQSLHFVNRNAKNYNVEEIEAVSTKWQSIDCDVNKEYSIQCRRDGDEVYLPFSFVEKYFEVYGGIQNTDGLEKFQFSYSYSEVHLPPDVIKPDGIFMSFQHYNVEIRKRVKCVTAIEGVPVSTQWELAGHYYPIQIAQFGLSHYSKHIIEGEPDQMFLLTGHEGDLKKWQANSRTTVRSLWDQTKASQVVEFHSSDSLSSNGLSLQLKESTKLSLILDIKMITNGSITVTLKTGALVFNIHYVFSNTLITCDGKNIFYGLGKNRIGQWIHFVRDLDMDIIKGLTLKCSKHKKSKVLTLLGISVSGHGWIDNVTLSTDAHMDHFFDAANWFVNNQDSRGGWSIMVARKLIPGIMELPPGWYSAMAQGHGISTLVRAYLKSNNIVYLNAAVSAVKLFEISSAQGGVKARFANCYDWYEEYPTNPSSFVLNGFIYSLFGLYDLKHIVKGEALEIVTTLYSEGIKSLKAMLLMFDSGAGTFYDLRHLSAGLAPNRARWDYHTVHVSQLLQLTKMENEPLFVQTVERWKNYMVGVRSPHN